ncbi:AraC family transcriptional regulator [Pseudoalteromonas sp. APC 3358]|uniref:AraC family transcriptional regulator n=1 Tax=Brumicola blandensis TaxID=3075611 RepID=A0AAW8R013_9ALTE|nr:MULTISPECIES: AraC family transcriptional regulator [Alteromonadales]MDN3385169.1 AraC family transcriptional regulator [Pseudoalteromonas sp. APC 3358]MDT0581542.1 AraC family transcriptional regulator [Alteromonas sp. W409]
MEILSDILNALRVSGSVYFCSHVEPPWTKEFLNKTTAGFHLVRRGACWVKIGDQIDQLYAGDLIFLGPGVDHILTSIPPPGKMQISGDSTLLLCGNCSFESDKLSPLNEIFHQVTIVREDELNKHPWLKSTFDQLSSEYMAQNPGNEIIVNKLTEVVLVELIRINFGRQEEHSFLRALKDKRIKKALDLIHSSPENPWTIEALATSIGMSRAAFAKKFTDLVGQTVFAYLSNLRIQKAKEMITTTSAFIDDIALAVGYESERAFTKTFNKYVGMTPKQFRKSK